VTKTKQTSEILVPIEKNKKKNTINNNITKMKVGKQGVKTST